MRQSLILRLRPFLRRDLRTKLVSAVVTVLVLTGLAWLGVSALTKIDSREAHGLRIAMGIESAWAVCGGPDQPACAYEDREQARVDAKFSYERRVRLAVLDELDRRIAHGLAQLDEATELVEAAKTDKRNGALQGDTVALRAALAGAVVDLRPALTTAADGRRDRLVWPLSVQLPDIPANCRDIDFDGIGWVGGCDLTANGEPNQIDQRRMVLEQIGIERATLLSVQEQTERLRARDGAADADLDSAADDRVDLVADHVPGREIPSDYDERMAIAGWLAAQPQDFDSFDIAQSNLVEAARKSGIPDVGEALGSLARHHVEDLARAVQDSGAPIWHGGWILDHAERIAIAKPSERYRSPV
ncbi:MAG TPA: hypothetical protein VFG69_16920 [Nannocystaceae bacterium]|nr:hypothetical protein [Nannocystaceae bacterium]